MTESKSRSQILDTYEKKGVDLPIVTLEMVLDRESSTAGQSKDVDFFGGLFGSSKSDKTMSHTDAVSAMDRSTPKQMGIREVDNGNFLMEEKESGVDNTQVSSGGACCCPNTQIVPQNKENNGKNADGTEATAVPGAATTSTSFFCCDKNQTTEEFQYTKSNLEVSEGFADVEEEAHLRSIINKGSLMDVDESVMTSNSEYQNNQENIQEDEEAFRKDDETFFGSTRFRWTMLFCCLLQSVLIALIIVVAHNSKKSEKAAVVPTGTSVTGSAQSQVSSQSSSAPESTSLPSFDPEKCDDVVGIESECFESSSDVIIYFQSCVPKRGDRIAIYDASEVSMDLVNEELGWVNTCGDQNCEDAVFSDVVSFSAQELLAEDAGDVELRAHLIRKGFGPSLQAIASSPVFWVLADGASC